MVLTKKMRIFVGLALAVLVVAAGELMRVDSATVTQAEYDGNISEVTGEVLAGQTFVSDYDGLSGISVMFATYSGRDNKQPVIFHLRQSIGDEHDLRSEVVNPQNLRDNQFYRFGFEPVENSRGETFFFFITSPYGVPGDAVTIDVSSKDPYFRGTAYLVKGAEAARATPDILSKSGKQGLDLAFQAHHEVKLRVAAMSAAEDIGRQFFGSWGEKKSGYWLWIKVALPGILWLTTLILIDKLFDNKSNWHKLRDKIFIKLLVGMFFLAVLMRLFYAIEMPATNDEGNYLYDARTLLEGKLAGGDGYVKAPLVIGWISAWIGVFGHALMAGRLSSVMIGALTMWPIYFIARELGGRKAGLMAAASWALFGVAAVFNAYVHTQSLAIFFGVSAVAILIAALRGKGIPGFTRETFGRPGENSVFIAVGILLGLGVVSRKSILALGLVPLIMVGIESRGWRQKINHLGLIGVGFMIVGAGFLMIAGYVYGVEGFWEAIGFNSAEDGVSAVEDGQEEQVRVYSLKGMTPFFRESLPLIMLAAIGLGYLMELAARKTAENVRWGGEKLRVWGLDRILGKIGWIPAIAAFWWAWSFFREYEGSSIMVFGMAFLWYAMAAVLAVAVILPRPMPATARPKSVVASEEKEGGARKEMLKRIPPNVMKGISYANMAGKKKLTSKKDDQTLVRQVWSGYVAMWLWIGGLVFFYMNWIKFHANYIGEFLPPLVILAGIGAPVLWRRMGALPDRIAWWSGKAVVLALKSGTAAVMLWALFVSGFVTYVYEHTGTFQLDAVAEAANWAAANIPQDREIFTGAGLIPYISGHHTVLDIAHPRWYAYEWIRTNETRLNTFLPPKEEMLQAFREAEWFLLDKQTGFSFLMEYSEIERAILEEQGWERVHGIENGSNTLTFYKRVSSNQ